MGYKGRARELLERFNISEWDEILLEAKGLKIRAILLPGPETDEYLYIKLPNGYNIAFNVNSIKSIRKLGHIEPHYTLPKLTKIKGLELPELALIHAGGTIASRVDYSTGAIAPAFTPEELSWAIPEIFEIANWKLTEVFNIFSENIKPEHWQKLAEVVYKEFLGGAVGVIITHGTDTLHFSATALAFMIENLPGTLVLTGAMRSSDRPASDAATNLIASAILAKESKIKESVIVMHSTPSDIEFYAYRGVRTMKLHSSRRDAFRSIGIGPLAKIDILSRKVTYLSKSLLHKNGEIKLVNNFESKVALLYIYPGFPQELIDILVDRKYRGLVLVGTGMGHVPEYLFESIKRAIENGMIIIMTTQCYWGGVFMNVYETGRKLISMGVIPGKTMLPHVAYIKLGWLLGQELSEEDIKRLILKDMRGEFVFRESINNFIR